MPEKWYSTARNLLKESADKSNRIRELEAENQQLREDVETWRDVNGVFQRIQKLEAENQRLKHAICPDDSIIDVEILIEELESEHDDTLSKAKHIVSTAESLNYPTVLVDFAREVVRLSKENNDLLIGFANEQRRTAQEIEDSEAENRRRR
jgi:hypothetical protein